VSVVGAQGARERLGIQQATEADWLTTARDFNCAEPSKTRPPSSMAVTCVGGWCAESERETEHTASN
jgi:hypothetical protein